MDGNGRWAKERNLPRTAGHREGTKRVKEIVKAAAGLGIKVITFFAFSNENWQRPKSEIDMLMRVLVKFLDQEVNRLHKNNIKFLVIGRRKPLPDYVQDKLEQAVEKTRNNSGLCVVLALNYGARQEIIDAVKKIAVAASQGSLDIENLDVDNFSQFLYTAGLPDPDLLIRTSNEMRLSNFLLWQLSYAEIYFAKKCWPDFGSKDFEKAVKEYQRRERRFGKVGDTKEDN